MWMSNPLACEKHEQATAYIIICLFSETPEYIVARTWNSSLRALASDFLFRRLSQLPVCLER